MGCFSRRSNDLSISHSSKSIKRFILIRK
ncbi:hypothetical protein CY0110_16627 [Crocosphaera chwakensis CCY0110]|uniref:Uncharacterized protein n=1 Tax=Crocosphaera chwakensis CCY0110 TaxID=391612 RepID=A3II07_9CHRO|nr:hypothetical protein CY0110_16627 [Crocosphaera chwakensis CCY0110]